MKRQKLTGFLFVNGFLLLIVILWSIPTIGLLISSFRLPFDIQTSGWWTVFPHRSWETVSVIENPREELGVDPNAVMQIEGVSGTFEEFREGVDMGDVRVTWIGNKRIGRVEIQEQVWSVNWDFTLQNYETVIFGKDTEIQNPDNSTTVIPGQDMKQAFLNSLAVAVPSTVIPILIAMFAAYAFAWMKFPLRRWFFIMMVALLVVPLQIALVPILSDYNTLGINGEFLSVWLAHTGFGLALATYLFYNYISTLPRETLESAFIDGASHFTVFIRLVLPLSVPALASFAIFQFLWVWNDYLVALVFLGADPTKKVLTQRLADLTGTFGNAWHLLTAGAFVTMILPMIVFIALQRYFVRGLMAGSVKG
ncbi:MAG: sugar ABC transporter permease [Chloroflexi bacterium]|nr:MAG: sugar ABC transporter permease [Chloroflexota bacterium]